uniref:CS domain-containing protein n=1 Tax=Enterobius vermicularis TaxID=51028 RepID=A0A0N4V1T3_ENTVE
LFQKLRKNNNTLWWQKCCSKGIYLTDVCVPSRCSNSTIQLCCVQKFLQARYRCCNNESQNVMRPTDSFSKCCYENFVDTEMKKNAEERKWKAREEKEGERGRGENQDTCCPLSATKRYWPLTAELCLPNVSVNLTEIKIEAKISDSEQIVVNLDEDRSWDYKCTYGTSVMQFIYLPDTDKF